MSTPVTAEIKTARLHYAGGERFVAESQTGHALVTSFAHEHVSAPTPMELLLIALGGCSGADIVAILEKKRQHVTSYDIEVRAERRAEHPRIYKSIEVVHHLSGRGLDAKAVEHAIDLSRNKYCSVSAMLGATATVTMRYQLSEDRDS
jgi:putative redox protein